MRVAPVSSMPPCAHGGALGALYPLPRIALQAVKAAMGGTVFPPRPNLTLALEMDWGLLLQQMGGRCGGWP